MPSKSQTDWAYLAGFIDGEGTLTITRHTRKDRPGYIRFNLRLAIYNTNIEHLRSLQAKFGGALMVAKRGGNHKPQGQLAWAEAQISEILEGVRPYLILKARQADILLDMQRTKMSASLGRRSGLTPEIIARREAARDELRLLNQRGVNAL